MKTFSALTVLATLSLANGALAADSKPEKAKEKAKATPVEVTGVVTGAEWGDLPHCFLKPDGGGDELDLYNDPDECKQLKGKRVRVTYTKEKMFVEGAGQDIDILRVSEMKLVK